MVCFHFPDFPLLLVIHFYCLLLVKQFSSSSCLTKNLLYLVVSNLEIKLSSVQLNLFSRELLFFFNERDNVTVGNNHLPKNFYNVSYCKDYSICYFERDVLSGILKAWLSVFVRIRSWVHLELLIIKYK